VAFSMKSSVAPTELTAQEVIAMFLIRNHSSC
jgi:hypothetical protein